MTAQHRPSARQLLAHAAESGLDRLDAHVLLSAVLQRSRAWLIANDDAPVGETDAAAFRRAVARRRAGEPVAYIVGEKEFHGLDLKVGPGVLVPRPDTETLVDWAIELLNGPLADRPSPRVLDLGTGSGAIALAVARAVPRARVTAVDASEVALATARSNGERLGIAVDWRLGDWWSAVAGRFDLVASNPPYVAADDPHLAALQHEPITALVSGVDGLDDIRRIVGGAGPHLARGAWLLLEHGHDQAIQCAGLLDQAGFAAVQSRKDLGGIARCTGGRVAA